MDETSQIKIGVCGGVDSGKSSLIGVLTHNKLDDGKGYARSLILKSKHEKESGRTSNVSYNYIGYPNENKEVTLIDLAGHIKYLKTTLYGITGHFLDYGIVVVGSNMGINVMTKEHMTILLWLKIPFIVVMTKVDMCPENVYVQHKKRLRQMLKIPLFSKRSIVINTEEDFETLNINCQNENYFNTMIPIISTSCKTGQNIDNLHKMLKVLPISHKQINVVNIPQQIHNVSILTYIECIYNVKGVGIVVTGFLGETCTPIHVGSELYIGPFGTTQIKLCPVRVRGLHDNFRQSLRTIMPGHSFCANIRFPDIHLEKSQIKKGMVLTSDPSIIQQMSMKFKAKIKMLNFKTTVGLNYTPVIHCRTIRQAARVTEIFDDEKAPIIDDGKNLTPMEKIIRGDTEYTVEFTFDSRPEYIEIGAPLFFRDGTTKGFGEIIDVL